jgi:dextranase
VASAQAVDGIAHFGAVPEGGYGVEADGCHSALDVLADPLARPRYGFVSHYEPDRDPSGVAENVRRLHLNAIQFYDWMFRHADLLPPSDRFYDALGQEVSLETVRALATATVAAGALPLAYAAVYAAGEAEWPEWREEGLYHADGEPWQLADFLWIVDPSSERWLAHLAGDLRRALEVGFAGFHLDQYGAPKRAARLDGRIVDLSAAFPALVDRLASELAGARLIFNNVNDFPTWTTARAAVDAVYVEVWPPHDRLSHLADLIVAAQAAAPEKAVVLAAYLEPYAADDDGGRGAERLQLATIFSHGATALLHGEEDAVLTDPYYVRHTRQSATSLEATRSYYDFAVRHGDLLFDRAAVDVTRSLTGGVNEELRVDAPVRVATDCLPGSLWVRAVSTPRGLLVHLIDLSPQDDDRWNVPKPPGRPLDGVSVRFERAGETPVVRFADPDDEPVLRALTVRKEPRRLAVDVPPFRTWAMLWIAEQEV